MNEPLISVIVPIYNVEKFLSKCINSILKQSYKNLEVLLVDDGSTDSSGKICDEYADKYDYIKVFHNRNQGLSAARNYGIHSAKGEIIGFIDPDDWIECDFYKKLYNTLDEFKADIVICGYSERNADEKTINKTNYKSQFFEDKRDSINALCGEQFHNYVWNKLFRKKLFDEIQFPDGKSYEDLAVMHKLFFKADRIVILKDALYNYLIRPDSLVHQRSKYIDAFEMFYQRYLELQQLGLDGIDPAKRITLQRAAEYAFRVMYIYPQLFQDIGEARWECVKKFWTLYKKKISRLNRDCFFRVYFPYLFVYLKKMKDKK